MNVNKKIPLVLVGLGRMGANHLRVIQSSPDFQLTGIVDVAGENPGLDIPFFRNLESIKSVECDLVVIAASTENHFSIANQALDLGKSILIEKPLASTIEQCKILTEKAKKLGLLLAVGHIERHNAAVRKLKNIIDAGIIGKPIHFSFTRVGGYPSNIKAGNNVILDLAVHDLDILNFLAGHFNVKSALAHSIVRNDTLDTAELLLANETGTSAAVHVNWITPTKIRTVRVTGTKGVCIVDYILQTCTVYGGELLKAEPSAPQDFEQIVAQYQSNDKIEFGVTKEEPLVREYRELWKAMKNKKSEICTAESGTYAVMLAENAVKLSSS